MIDEKVYQRSSLYLGKPMRQVSRETGIERAGTWLAQDRVVSRETSQLLSNAEAREDGPKYIVRGEFTGDRSK
jgi:hypothetical protein